MKQQSQNINTQFLNLAPNFWQVNWSNMKYIAKM